MALKFGSLNLNLKTVQPKISVTPLHVIGFSFNKTNVAKLIEASRQSKLSMSLDDVNALTAMLPVFDSPQYNPKFAISGSPEMASVIAKAAPTFSKYISMYWEKNFTSLVFTDKIEEEVLEVIKFLKEHLLFFVSKTFRPKSDGEVKMRSADYILLATRKMLTHFKQKKVSAEAQEVWDFMTGVLEGLFNTIQKGRELANTYISSGALIELVYNSKPSSTVEMAEAETVKAFLFIQQQFASKNTANAHKASPIYAFAEESQGNEYPLKTLLTNVIELLLNPENVGTEETLVENSIKEVNSEFEDSYEGLHKNSPASQLIEISENTPTVPSKKGK